VRGRDPLDLRIEELSYLVEAAPEVVDVDALEGGEQCARPRRSPATSPTQYLALDRKPLLSL
jgi:hypothetical protein